MTFKKYGIGLAVAAALGVAGSAQAVMIDDMAYTGAPVNGQAVDTTADGNGVYNNPTIGAASRGTGGSGAWVDGSGNRIGQLFANLISGDQTTTEDCPNCRVSHSTDKSTSTSHNFLLWQAQSGHEINLGAGESVAFDVETDVGGGDFFITLLNNGGTVAQHQWQDVVATGLSLNPPSLLHAITLSFMAGAVTFDELRLDIISAGGSTYTDPTGLIAAGTDFGNVAVGLDTNIQNLRSSVPEPTTLAMLGLGLAGLGWQRRRKSA